MTVCEVNKFMNERLISLKLNLMRVGVVAMRDQKFGPSNKGMQLTRIQRVFYLRCLVCAADPQRYAVTNVWSRQ